MAAVRDRFKSLATLSVLAVLGCGDAEPPPKPGATGDGEGGQAGAAGDGAAGDGGAAGHAASGGDTGEAGSAGDSRGGESAGGATDGSSGSGGEAGTADVGCVGEACKCPPGTWGDDCSITTALISAGEEHTCALKSDGTLACWGNDLFSQASPPLGTYSAVAAGGYHSCALSTDGSVACWGLDTRDQASAPSGTFTDIAAGFYGTCAVTSDGEAMCWGDYMFTQAIPAGPFSHLALGYIHACGLRPDGSVACWGYNGSGEGSPPVGQFEAITAGAYFTCGLRTDGEVKCWGRGEFNQLNAPTGAFSGISAHTAHSCGVVSANDSVSCWGTEPSGALSPALGSFSAVATGAAHTCGVKQDGGVLCWGNNDQGRSSPPSGERPNPHGPRDETGVLSCAQMKGNECQGESCCASPPVTGGTFKPAAGAGISSVKVATFALDKYEVTVGRFRRFQSTYTGHPADGAGANPQVPGSGWQSPAWDDEVAADRAGLDASLRCEDEYQTWRQTPSSTETLPINCASWFDAFAFCAWDGGRLPTETEWEYAAVGGAEARTYPWLGAALDNTEATAGYANYFAMGDGSTPAAYGFTDIIPVGSKPAGLGKYLQADLAGSMWEWTLDWYSELGQDATNRVARGGGWGDIAGVLVAGTSRQAFPPTYRNRSIGFRCARPAAP